MIGGDCWPEAARRAAVSSADDAESAVASGGGEGEGSVGAPLGWRRGRRGVGCCLWAWRRAGVVVVAEAVDADEDEASDAWEPPRLMIVDSPRRVLSRAVALACLWCVQGIFPVTFMATSASA